MRVLIHDFTGHPFPVQLSRELARRGHQVTHAHSIGFQGPKGQLNRADTDPATLQFMGIPLKGTFRKYSPIRRIVAHQYYARDLIRQIDQSQGFDVLLSGNTPIDIQSALAKFCQRRSIGFVHWVQDVYCLAIDFFLRKKLPILAAPLSYPFRQIERNVALRSNATIVISPAFKELLLRWSVPEHKISVIQNWASLTETPPRERDNPWAKEHGLTEGIVFLYSGTLGLKHRPELLYSLARSLKDGCKVVVVTEGTGREYLETQPPLNNLFLFDYQPYGTLPEVLATADVLLATLETDAGAFAVPSKILTYLCAKRPLLFAGPPANLSSQVVNESGGGIAVDSEKPEEWLKAATALLADPNLRARLATAGHNFAENTFDIRRIGDAFEPILLGARQQSAVTETSP